MAGNNYPVIIRGYEFRDVTNETTSKPTMTYEKAVEYTHQIDKKRKENNGNTR